MLLGKIVILGLPNVGKSALFNRLIRKRAAIVFDRPGVTRDCHERVIQLPSGSATLVDTPGVEDLAAAQEPSGRVRDLSELLCEQTIKSAKDAALILFVLGGDVVPAQMFSSVRKLSKPVVLVVNKCDLLKNGAQAAYSLGLDPVFVSAEHNTGISDLVHVIDETLTAAANTALQTEEEEIPATSAVSAESLDEDDCEFFETADSATASTDSSRSARSATSGGSTTSDEDDTLRLSIIGRPNVGKSTLVNALMQKNVQIVADIPGVTRDTIEFDWEHDGRKFLLSDTAGIRRRAKITDYLEKISVSHAVDSINFAHVCVLVIDAPEVENTDYNEFVQQDLLLASKAMQEGRCVVIALNKWDLVLNKKLLRVRIDESLQYCNLKFTPVVSISAKNNSGLRELLHAVELTHLAWNTRLPTAKLNKWLRELVAQTPPPASAMRRSKLKYITQTGTRPPEFVIFGTKMDDVPRSYRQFLENQLKQTFRISGPVRLRWRQQGNPYDDKSSNSHQSRARSGSARGGSGGGARRVRL